MMTQPNLDIEKVNAELERMSPFQILKWVWDTFGTRAAIQSSMQKTASSLISMAYTNDMEMDVLFVDTGVHFQETLDTRDLLTAQYGVNMINIHPEKTFEEQREEFGQDLYLVDGGYQTCCKLRKEIPFTNYVKGRYDIVIGGLMRSEGGKRSKISILNWDERIQAYKIYPLANWDEERVDAYNGEHGVPVNPLHKENYPSIGCSTCTTPIGPGENARAGRWRHIREAALIPVTHLYCGINREDK